MANKELLSDHQKVQQSTERDVERAEQRRKAALEREEKTAKANADVPEKYNARDTSLIPKKIRYASQDMIVTMELGTPRIKLVAFDHYQHIGNATYAITAILPISSSKKEIQDLQEQIIDNFKSNVIAVIKEEAKRANKLKKDLIPTMDLDTIIKEADKRTAFDFRTRTPTSSMFIRWCGEADKVCIELLKMAHAGLISEIDYMNRVSKMADSLHGFANYVYGIRKSAFSKLQKKAAADDTTKQEFEKVKKETLENSNIEIKDNGEIKEHKKQKEKDSNNDEKIA